MTTFLDKLNLSPGERRLVVVVVLAVFVVLNIIFVWPQFGKVSFWQNRRTGVLQTLKTYTDEIARVPQYQKDLKVLESQGVQVSSEEQALTLQRDVVSQAGMSGVAVERYDPVPRAASAGRTNAFFEEQAMLITVNTGEKELVDFLYGLGARGSLIRVKNMSLGPDPTRMRLKGTITLVESFQKKAPARPVAPPAAVAAAAAAAARSTGATPAKPTPATTPAKTSAPPAASSATPAKTEPAKRPPAPAPPAPRPPPPNTPTTPAMPKKQ
jgi:Tfp pilus assembly protein PilO